MIESILRESQKSCTIWSFSPHYSLFMEVRLLRPRLWLMGKSGFDEFVGIDTN